MHEALARDLTGSVETVVVYLDPECHGTGDYPTRMYSSGGDPVGETDGEALRFSLLFADARLTLPVGAMRKTARSAFDHQVESNPEAVED